MECDEKMTRARRCGNLRYQMDWEFNRTLSSACEEKQNARRQWDAEMELCGKLARKYVDRIYEKAVELKEGFGTVEEFKETCQDCLRAYLDSSRQYALPKCEVSMLWENAMQEMRKRL